MSVSTGRPPCKRGCGRESQQGRLICARCYSREARAKNPEYFRQKCREWARRNPDKVHGQWTRLTPEQRQRKIEATKRWAERNREHVTAYRREYQVKNRAHRNAVSQQWAERNRERRCATRRAWYNRNRETIRERDRARYLKNKALAPPKPPAPPRAKKIPVTPKGGRTRKEFREQDKARTFAARRAQVAAAQRVGNGGSWWTNYEQFYDLAREREPQMRLTNRSTAAVID